MKYFPVILSWPMLRWRGMTTEDILVDAFERIKEVVHSAVKGLDVDQLAQRPGPNANSIAWLIWHLTRVQDDHIADAAELEQVWTSDGWYEKFNLPFRSEETGFGHSNADVAVVQGDTEVLTGYYDAVHAVTIKFIKSLTADDYARIVDEDYDPPVSLGVRLMSVISDDLQHAGQAAYVRGLIA
jgi:uncharacterized damage-inducible protein DinB